MATKRWKELINILNKLSLKNEVAIISGRDKNFLEKWFGNLNITLFAEHGHSKKEAGGKWVESNVNNNWKDNFIPIFQNFTDRTPGTFLEEKENCLVWHYRKTDPELANDRVVELKTIINSLISENLLMMDVKKAIEITNININKGTAVNDILEKEDYDFILCAGDDVTDENMFSVLSKDAFTIKVGGQTTKASFFVENNIEMIDILKNLS